MAGGVSNVHDIVNMASSVNIGFAIRESRTDVRGNLIDLIDGP